MNLYSYPVELQPNRYYPIISDNKDAYDLDSLCASLNAFAQGIIRAFTEIANAVRSALKSIMSILIPAWKSYQSLTQPHYSKQTRAFLRVKQVHPVIVPHAHRKRMSARRIAVYQHKMNSDA